MATHFSNTQTIQNNKCPHGFPVGTCPICSGMGSKISSDRNKPRKAGEMSYNECLAQWKRMQAQKQAKLDNKKEMFEALNQISLKDKITFEINKINNFFSPLKGFLNSSPLIIKTPLNFIFKTISSISKFTFNTIAKSYQTITNLFNNTFTFLNSISEKISSLIGEIKNFTNEKIIKGIKTIITKSIKTILSLFCQTDKKDKNKEKQKIELRRIKKVIKKIFKKNKKEQQEI